MIRINKSTPLTQAAYRTGRGTTEQAHTMKLLAEKAITTPGYKTHILMMNMSKAFDRVQRHKVMEDLREILEKDELHMMKMLIENVKLTVRIDNTMGEEFTANIGTPQGDCLSPILFTVYLGRAMEKGNSRMDKPSYIMDHCYKVESHIT